MNEVELTKISTIKRIKFGNVISILAKKES